MTLTLAQMLALLPLNTTGEISPSDLRAVVTALYQRNNPIDAPKATANTPDDEFDASTLDGKWTAVTGTSGTVSLLETGEVQKYDLTSRPGWLLMQAGSAANQKVELRQDWTLGDGQSIIVKMASLPSITGSLNTGMDELVAGICLNDNDGGWDMGEWNALYVVASTDGLSLLHYDGTTVFGRTSDTNGRDLGITLEALYLRMTRIGSDVYAHVSSDGSTWMSLNKKTRASAATNVWVFAESVAAASEPVPIVAVDWVRQGTNSLDPWTIPW